MPLAGPETILIAMEPFARPQATTPADRRLMCQQLAERQGGVLSRTQLYAQGISRGEVRANVRAGRWQPLGRHCIVMHTGPLHRGTVYWAAVLEGGPRAYVDGESALVLAGLVHYEPERIRITVPRGARIRHRGTTLNIRQTRRWDPDDLAPGDGVRRSRPEVAAVRAALWAKSDRQAALLLTMPVQQGLCTAETIAVALLKVRRDRRRGLIQQVLLDLVGGIRSLNELDVVRGCRERGLPEPDKQVVRKTPKGGYYLDMRWKRWGVVVEVDGIQHAWVEHLVGDALRHNSIAISGDSVLRLPVLGLRLCPDEFFEQISAALRAAGCALPAAA